LTQQALHLVQGEPARHVAVDEVVRGGLVGDDVRRDAAPGDLGIDVGGVADEAHRERALLGDGALDHGERRVEIGGDLLEIADRLAGAGALRIDVDAQDRGLRHAPGEGLRAAHAAEARGEHEAPGEIAAESLLRDAHEDLVGPLDDALRADVLPRPRGEPAPADQALALQLVEDLRLGPLADDVAVRHDHERGVGMRPQERHRLAGLDDQRLVLLHRAQRLDDGAVRRPGTRGLAERGVDDELVRVLAHREHVLQEPQQRLLPPALGAQLGAAGNGEVRMAGIGGGHRGLLGWAIRF
jgi:hypothetical protein